MLLLSILMSCHESPTDPTPSGTLEILSYNIYGLPSELTGNNTRQRIEMIAPLLNDYDVVGIQEDWMDENHTILLEQIDKPIKRRFDEIIRGASGSGLSFFSVGVAIDDSDFHYQDCYGHLTNSNDCLASKGLQTTRVEIEAGVEIDFYNTHLDAGRGDEDAAVRETQVEEILNHIESWSENRPIVFTGDFNLQATEPIDAALLERLDAEGNLRDTCIEMDCSEPTLIDRIFIRDGLDMTLKPTDWTRDDRFIDPDGESLSNHPAISVSIAYEMK